MDLGKNKEGKIMKEKGEMWEKRWKKMGKKVEKKWEKRWKNGEGKSGIWEKY